MTGGGSALNMQRLRLPENALMPVSIIVYFRYHFSDMGCHF
jgi:hypothetical protein